MYTHSDLTSIEGGTVRKVWCLYSVVDALEQRERKVEYEMLGVEVGEVEEMRLEMNDHQLLFEQPVKRLMMGKPRWQPENHLEVVAAVEASLVPVII